ncbi:MAG: type I methionyl aminopeptidase [Phycisphaerae bacterium]|nr:type I methionyl aminopeptidase [Phycisphaerae bacterium]
MAMVKKSLREIELMRAAGRLVHEIHEAIRQAVRPGVTTASLDGIADEMIGSAGAEALFKGQRTPQAKMPYPSAICASVNEEVVHGIPGPRVLKEGDIVSIDVGVRLDGYCGDAAVTHPVGKISPQAQGLLDVTQEVLRIAIDRMRPGGRWSDVAAEMQKYAEDAGYGVVRDFVGHGIGREMWEDPKVPNFADRNLRQNDIRLEPGLVLAVEPMINMGTARVQYASDGTGWTVVTRDGKWAAHFEHMLAVTEDGVDVLTDGR